MVGCGALSLLGIGLVALVLIAALASGPETAEEAGSGEEASPGAAASSETFTRENYGELAADPDAHAGTTVDVVGRVFQPPESQGGEMAFQMWADPQNAEWNTVVFTDEALTDLRIDDYVRVRGEVTGSFDGENAFGGMVSAIEVDAESVEVIDDPMTALDPAVETVEVGRTQSDRGFSVTLQRIEFGEETTRVYISAQNGTSSPASLWSYDARLVQGQTQIEPETPFEYDVPEIPSDLDPGVRAEGVLLFGSADPSQPLRLRLEWYSENYNITPEPLIFQVGS